MSDKIKNAEKLEKFVEHVAGTYGGDSIPDDLVADEIVGRSSVQEHLGEIGIKAKDIKEDKDDNPFVNVDVEDLLDKIKYDDNY